MDKLNLQIPHHHDEPDFPCSEDVKNGRSVVLSWLAEEQLWDACVRLEDGTELRIEHETNPHSADKNFALALARDLLAAVADLPLDEARKAAMSRIPLHVWERIEGTFYQIDSALV